MSEVLAHAMHGPPIMEEGLSTIANFLLRYF